MGGEGKGGLIFYNKPFLYGCLWSWSCLPTTTNLSLSTQFYNLRTFFFNHIPSMIKPPWIASLNSCNVDQVGGCLSLRWTQSCTKCLRLFIIKQNLWWIKDYSQSIVVHLAHATTSPTFLKCIFVINSFSRFKSMM
jgi:hypothetical protein